MKWEKRGSANNKNILWVFFFFLTHMALPEFHSGSLKGKFPGPETVWRKKKKEEIEKKANYEHIRNILGVLGFGLWVDHTMDLISCK